MDVETLAALLTPAGQELLNRAAEPIDGLALGTALRKEFPAELVAAAQTQVELRRHAEAKFGADAAAMFFTRAGYEQSTRASVAAHRAERYASTGVTRVADLCCGIGADAIAFARAGIAVVAVDRDPLTCAVATANAEASGLGALIEVRCEDVQSTSLDGVDAAFLDPARRTARGRVFDPDAYSPPWSFIGELASRVPNTGVKVAPGIPHELVPHGAEVEWVSDHGGVKEAGIYFGALAGAVRRATLLPSGASLAAAAIPDPPVGPIGKYLYEPDGAVIRAHLLGECAEALGGASRIDETIAYLTSDELVSTPLATPYAVTDVMPFHLKRLKALVRERGYGTLEIKKRGSSIDPEHLRRQLRPAGTGTATLIVTRANGEPVVIIARRPCEG